MQLKLPIYPHGTKLISSCLGVYEKDGIVQYIVNGLPTYTHPVDDLSCFRFITSCYIEQGLCKKVEVQRGFSVSGDSVARWHKKYVEKGEEAFFSKDARKGRPYKIVGKKRDCIQGKLDKGQSVNSIAKEESVRESAIRYQIKQGYLKKKASLDHKDTLEPPQTPASTPNERNQEDAQAPMGVATTRTVARAASSLGKGSAPIVFEPHQGVYNAGVLFLIPALLSQGLLKTKKFYQFPSSHYYQLEQVVLTLAIMALCRIKNPEQIKQCKVGELGKLIGLDRIPEVKCLRKKIGIISKAEQARNLNNTLVDYWYGDKENQDATFLYIGGHTRVYHGHKGNIAPKFISRQKLCLSATAEFWVNDQLGMPMMVIIGELNEKLPEMIKEQIVPELKKTKALQERNDDQPRCTLVFDREAYHPKLFHELWEQERIAIITYRKNVKDKWDEESFKETEIKHNGQEFTMHLCEREVTLSGHSFREVRKLSINGHQTSIIATNPTLSMGIIAVIIFSRWSQENFFKHSIADSELLTSRGLKVHYFFKIIKITHPPNFPLWELFQKSSLGQYLER